MALISPQQAKIEKEIRIKKLSKKMNNSDRKAFLLNVPKNVYKQFKRKLSYDGMTITEFLNRMILNYIENEDI